MHTYWTIKKSTRKNLHLMSHLSALQNYIFGSDIT